MVTTVMISGMVSEHCKRAVYTSLAALPGISTAEITMGRAVVEHDGSVTADSLKEAISVTGYEVVDVVEDRRRLPIV